MQVLKFGGTSVANSENIIKVVKIILSHGNDRKTVVVISAFSGITDMLHLCGTMAAAGNEEYRELLLKIEHRHLDAVRELIPIIHQSALLSNVKKCCNELEEICNGIFLLNELSSRTLDRILSYGELLSSKIVFSTVQASEKSVTWIDARELIITDANYNNARVDFELTNRHIRKYFGLHEEKLFIVPGFIGSHQSVTTTLGRGGSDYTAAIFAGAIQAERLEIWTDVDGMMTADPRIVTNARTIARISYQEAMELSHFGAKVIYPPTIQPALREHIPISLKNTFYPANEGTLITNDPVGDRQKIRGISGIANISLLSLEGSGMVGIPGFSKRLFATLSSEKINVILITQASSEHSICVGIEQSQSERAKKIIDEAFSYEITSGYIEPLAVEEKLAIVALVGDNMKNHTGISGKMFGALGRNGINIRAIAQGSSERNISAVIAADDIKKAINVLHEEFFETTYRQLNLFVAGIGNVGSKLLRQLHQQQEHLKEHLGLQLRIIGVANSRKMLFSEQGIDVGNFEEEFKAATATDLAVFTNEIISRNLRNSVFADITSSEDVASLYGRLLKKSISVVACNKIACSSEYSNYKNLKSLAREYNASFLFETNVGAGLPVISTLSDLLRSGDSVTRIEAVLSGTLNFVFNNYNGEKTFSEVVRQAQDEGYTEPDPRLDLSGIDVMRKIMILARETGDKIEMTDIVNESFMPPSCMEGSVEKFYDEMTLHEAHFKNLYLKSKEAGKKLKYVAQYENGKAKVGLQYIDPSHDFFHLYGKDNAVTFYTSRYVDQPLVIKGAGAGAEVTASGVFADIIKTGKI
jgi:aspartate kinase